jgi:conjugal transfer pilus assembly protein TraD
VLGKLVINDIKAVVERHKSNREIFTVFDEFSVFAGEQVLNLVNMGRGKGVHAIFGTQGLADLARVDEGFKSQVLNCVNTVICHRLNDQESAEAVSGWIGTRNAFTVTSQLSVMQGDTGMGTVKQNRKFIVHPDEIKQELRVGEAFYASKVGRFRCEKVVVKF